MGAQTAATADAGPPAAPPQVILRVKRRREEAPVELLVLEAEEASGVQKRSRRGVDVLSQKLAALTTARQAEGGLAATADK
jgi:hypothetical protein